MNYILKLVQELEAPEVIMTTAANRGIKLNRLLPTAAWWGHAELVAALLKRGVDPMTEGRSGAPSVAYALQWGHRSTVMEFLKVLPSTLIVNCPWVTSFTHYPLGQQPCEIPMVGSVNILLHRVCYQRGE